MRRFRAAAPLLVGLALLLRLGLAAPTAHAAPVASDDVPVLAPAAVLLAVAADDETGATADSDEAAEEVADDAPPAPEALAPDEVGDTGDAAPAAEATDAAADASVAESDQAIAGASAAEPNQASADEPAAEPASAAPVAASAPRAERAEPLDFPAAALDVTLKLAAVLALAYVTLWLVKRYSLGATLGKRSGAMQVIESTTLAPNRSVYLLNVEGRRLLLGVTPSQITTLAAWDGDGVAQPVPAPQPGPTTVPLDEPLTAK